MIKACKQVTISSLSSSTYISRGRPLSSTQFDMQVKGEAIEEHISDKEATYQRSISVLYTIEATYQRCISTRSLMSLSSQSHLGKLFKRRPFMVDICKWSYIINAIKEYRLLGFFSMYRVSPEYMCCWCACLLIYIAIAIRLWFGIVEVY